MGHRSSLRWVFAVCAGCAAILRPVGIASAAPADQKIVTSIESVPPGPASRPWTWAATRGPSEVTMKIKDPASLDGALKLLRHDFTNDKLRELRKRGFAQTRRQRRRREDAASAARTRRRVAKA